MPRIGTFELPETQTVVDSRTEFVLGRVRRVLRITSFLTRFADKAEFNTQLETLKKELERFDRGETDLSVRDGRFFKGRRRKWTLTREEGRCLAVASLEAITDDRYERSETLSEETAVLSASPQDIDLSVGGNWPSLPSIELTTTGSIENPSFSDGTRTLEVPVDLEAGETLTVDSENRTVDLDGDNVLHSVSGDFPELAPGSPTLTYSDETAGGPSGSLTIAWRDRWVG